ncbi:MAG: cysteine--tRNA ligase, partial [Acaryochloridaceae cyanobacterium SU_2_1]|nr:cysteine--tRNA ligase [Acaryochloridaceae cyanobacterium SU_2_1]
KQGNLLNHQGQSKTTGDQLRAQWQALVCLAQVLGLESSPREIDSTPLGIADTEIELLIEARQTARQRKDYQESDLIRDQLKAQGISLIDQGNGVTRWHRD